MEQKRGDNNNLFSRQIEDAEERKLKMRKVKKKSPLAGFGLFGIIGWSVVMPTLTGTAIGVWMDKHYHQSFSWTLSLLVAGLATGCYIAWYWVNKENKEMHQNNKK